ncbi:MAG: AI-2E family transporter [Cyanothece sp. SIO2G6]|nr:AI-2E family transporter [Cyanothece sp. SIO2G6]
MKFGQWLGLICLAIALVILWQVRQMVLLIFAAIVLATALNSLTRQWRRIGIRNRNLAVVLTLIFISFCGFLFIALVIPPFIEQFQRLLEKIPRNLLIAARNIETFIDNPPERLERFVQDNLQDSLFNDSIDLTSLSAQIQPLIRNLLQNFVDFFSSSLGLVLRLLLVIAITLMFLSNPQSYRQVTIKLFPSFYRRRADEILTECEIALGNWMGGILINSIFVAAMSWSGLRFLGIELELAHALLAGLLNFIPNIGPVISVVFPLAVALQDPNWKILAIIILYVAIQNLESYWISPMVMARQVSLLPAITLCAQLFFATFFGVLGLMLALPLTVVAKTWIEEALIKDILDRCGASQELSATLQTTAPELDQLLYGAGALEQKELPSTDAVQPSAVLGQSRDKLEPSSNIDHIEEGADDEVHGT